MKQRYIYIIVAVLLVGAFSAWGIPWRKTSNSNTTYDYGIALYLVQRL